MEEPNMPQEHFAKDKVQLPVAGSAYPEMRESCFLLGNARRDCLPLNEREAKERAEDLLLLVSGTEETQESPLENMLGSKLLESKIPG